MTHNPRQHSGWQTAARRRNEEWIACPDCSVVSRAEDEPESVNDFVWAFVAFAFLIGTFLVFTYVMAAAQT